MEREPSHGQRSPGSWVSSETEAVHLDPLGDLGQVDPTVMPLLQTKTPFLCLETVNQSSARGQKKIPSVFLWML